MSDRITRRDEGDAIGRKNHSQSLRLRRIENKEYPPEVKDLIKRAQPSLPNEAKEIVTRLEAQKPDKQLPIDRDLFQFPAQTEGILHTLRISSVRGEASIPPELLAAYEQRSVDIQRLWQLVQPESYALLEKYELNLKLTGTLLHAEIERENATTMVPDRFSIATYTQSADGRKYLLVDTKCTPGEAIGYCIDYLSLIDRYAKAIETGVGRDFSHVLITPMQERYQRTLYAVELNHMLGKYGIPERYNPLQRKYRQAYERAIREAYTNGTIGSETSDETLRALGKRAGRKVIQDICKIQVADHSSLLENYDFEHHLEQLQRAMLGLGMKQEESRDQLYSTQYPERLPMELRRAEQLGVQSFKLGTPEQLTDIGNAQMRATIESWAHQQALEVPPQEHPIVTEQRWLWTITESDELMVAPAYISIPRSEDTPLIYQMGHIIVAKGEPIKAGGEYILRIEQPSHPKEKMQMSLLKVSLKDANNFTGHYTVLQESVDLYYGTGYLNTLVNALRLNGINANVLKTPLIDYSGLAKLAQTRVARLQRKSDTTNERRNDNY